MCLADYVASITINLTHESFIILCLWWNGTEVSEEIFLYKSEMIMIYGGHIEFWIGLKRGNMIVVAAIFDLKSTKTYALQKSINLIFLIALKVEIFELSRIYLADSFYIQTNYDIKLPKEITFLYLIYQSFNAYMIF